MKEYMDSSDYRENDIEQLLVYFTFRYIMNAIYDSNIMVYAYLSVMFTMIVRDMNATRFYKKRWQLHHRGPDGGGKDLLQGSGAFRGKCGGRQGRNHLGIVDLEIKYIINIY